MSAATHTQPSTASTHRRATRRVPQRSISTLRRTSTTPQVATCMSREIAQPRTPSRSGELVDVAECRVEWPCAPFHGFVERPAVLVSGDGTRVVQVEGRVGVPVERAMVFDPSHEVQVLASPAGETLVEAADAG